MAYKLDSKNAKTLQISNDSFWYLYQEEEMIDEDNMNEAEEILKMFPNGFIIKDNYCVVTDDTSLIECTFIPYVQDIDIEWDGEFVFLTSNKQRTFVVLFKINNKDSCYIRWYDERDGRILKEGNFSVVYFNNNPWCEIPSNNKYVRSSLIPLVGNRVKYFTKNRF